MHLDWQQRAALERRMRGRPFFAASRILGRAIVDASLDGVADRLRAAGASDADAAFVIRCHGIAGRLRTLGGTSPDVLPPAVADAVAREATQLDRRAARLAEAFDTVGRAAAAAGLALAPLKGTVLRLTHYRDGSHRPSADLDLLTAPADRAAWTALLRDLGYTRIVSDGRHTSFTRPDDRPAAAEGEHPDHPCPIEVHEHLVEHVLGARVDITAAYRAGLVERTLRGVPALVPGPSAEALHLVQHAASSMLDRGLRLVQVLDVAILDDAPATRDLLRRELGVAAWAVVALAERDLPGLVPRGYVGAFDGAAPGPLRRAIVRRRPGLLTGDPWRVDTISGHLLLSGSPISVVRRVAAAVTQRSAYVDDGLQATNTRGAVTAFARSLLARDEPPPSA
jgi:hypothetical protein